MTSISIHSTRWRIAGLIGLLAIPANAIATPPTISHFWPAGGPVGTVVKVTGKHFTGATRFNFYPDVAATFTVVSDTTLKATVPANAQTGVLHVITPAGTGASATSFTVKSSNSSPPTITSFTANPASISAGGSSTLSWSVKNATSLALSGIGAVTGTSFTVTPSATTTYTLTASNAAGNVTAGVQVVVTNANGVTLAPAGSILPASGGTRTLQVTCGTSWQVSGGASWISASPQSGTGNGTVAYTVSANSGASPRSATLTIGGQPFLVSQDGVSALVHPRLWLTPADVTRYQSWEVSTGVGYQNVSQALQQLLQIYNSRWGTSNWQDNGGITSTADNTESYAEFLAFMSLLQTDPVKQADLANRARNMLMFVINQAALGYSQGVPFRDPMFPEYDRARWTGEAFPLIVDWIYPYLTTADKAQIQKVFLMWSNSLVTGGEAPWLVNPKDRYSLRGAANNYFLGHFRNLTMMSLSLDPADDPPVNPSQPPSTLGNTVHSYYANATGVWLADLAPLFDTGDASGGLPTEGFLYGECTGFMHEALLALHTSGQDDPALAGPQIGLEQSAYWDQMIDGLLASLPPTSTILPGLGYLGPVYQMVSYGDNLRLWIIPEWITMFGSLAAMDEAAGNTQRLQDTRWIVTNVLEAAGDWTAYNSNKQWWYQPNGGDIIQHYMMLDPSAPTPQDPRPNRPLAFFDQPLGRLLVRTDWTANASLFGFNSSWITNGHQNADAMAFTLFRKGEWLTKERGGYALQWILSSTDYHNTLSLENDHKSSLQWFETQIDLRGSQWLVGENMGDPTLIVSVGNGYTYGQTDATNLYNRVGPYGKEIKHASRDILWLEPDIVVTYDRATSWQAGYFKRFNLQLPNNATISGNLTTATTAGGQKLFVQTLLPANASLTVIDPVAAGENDNPAEGEPMQFRLKVEDLTKPADTRFLHVIQGADATGAPIAAQLLTQDAGTSFQGVLVGSTAIWFPYTLLNSGNPFASLTYTVPSSVSSFVCGLTPQTGYTVSKKTVSGGIQVTVTPGGNSMTDSAGLLAF